MELCKVALIGNPNVGKTSLFNLMSGLHQKTGNYPGITVDVSKGSYVYENVTYELIDLPGIYSIYPNSVDEEIVYRSISNPNHPDYPDKIIVVVDPLNLKRSLLLFLQIKDLGFPTLLVFNFLDELEKKGISLDESQIQNKLENPVVFTNARSKECLPLLKEALKNITAHPSKEKFEIPIQYVKFVEEIKSKKPNYSEYEIWTALAQPKPELIPDDLQSNVIPFHQEYKVVPKRLQVVETIRRYEFIDQNLPYLYKENPPSNKNSVTDALDAVVTHPIWGYGVFLIILYGIFQSMFYLAQFPMDLIEGLFARLSEGVTMLLPHGPLQKLIADGIVTGIGGIVVFIPLIAILFLILILLEEIGYMSRVVFLMDRWLKPFGLSGKSVVPLISGVACAIPAILSARNIENSKERLITKLVTPFMTCSARLPVYSIIIFIIIPPGKWGIFNQRALALMALYLMGFFMALGVAFVLKKLIKSEYKSYLVVDMPSYKWPILNNVILGVWHKCKDFILGAGKIILAFSIILWVLGSFGPSTQFDSSFNYNEIKLEDSYLGKFGKSIEPAIKPLGYDWKIGVGLISSFAAREIFISTMATIYSIENESEGQNLKLSEKLRNEINVSTGKPVFNFATGMSLLVFYAFAMQCMSTIATLKKETHGWKWPIIQTLGMTSIAYICALITYQILK